MSHPATAQTVWNSFHDVPIYKPLLKNETADVCIAGAGIAGLSIAYQLVLQKRSVIVIDERGIGAGEIGHTSAHLSSASDDMFAQLEASFGQDGTRLFYESHAAAIDEIASICQQEKIDCDFQRLDAYLFLAPADNESLLDNELAAAHRAGFVSVQKFPSVPVNGNFSGPCLRFPHQARFHPLKYLAGLARAIEKRGGRIFAGNRVVDITGGTETLTKTREGHIVTAGAAVAATNVPSPINNWMGIYTKQAAYRSYMTAFEVAPNSVTDALYWDTADPYHYARLIPGPTRTILIVGGEDHKTGQATDQAARCQRLEQWTRERFPDVGRCILRWSGQLNEPDDGVAFIGRVPTNHMENAYVVTGDSGMGITHATIAGFLIRDLIGGHANPWQKLYDPARKPLHLHPAAEFIKENANVAAQYADLLMPGQVTSPDQIPLGSGAILRKGLSQLAVYRDDTGHAHACSALCTHLKCIVQWNDAEKSWDCPCHGSRFDSHGKLLMGPAIQDLPKEKL